MKLSEKNYSLQSDKLNQSCSFVLLSDFHFAKNYNMEKLFSILNYVFIKRPDYVVIPGDILDDSAISVKDLIPIREFLKAVASYSKVIVSNGNHENQSKNANKKWIEYRNDEWIKEIETIDNLTLLDNSTLYDKKTGLSFSGYTLPFSHYEIYKETKEDLVKNVKKCEEEMFIKNNNSNLDSNYYNVALFHTPLSLLKSWSLKKTGFSNKYQLAFFGHMHGGIVPTAIENMFAHHGLVSPQKTIGPNFCRGHVRKGNMDAIISTGISKLNNKLSDKIFIPEVSYVKVLKKEVMRDECSDFLISDVEEQSDLRLVQYKEESVEMDECLEFLFNDDSDIKVKKLTK